MFRDMPRREPSRQPVPSGPLSGPVQVRVRRDADGRVQIVSPPRSLIATVEAAERPPQPDDPRPALLRNVPPYGGAV
jgi:hypothetical protein